MYKQTNKRNKSKLQNFSRTKCWWPAIISALERFLKFDYLADSDENSVKSFVDYFLALDKKVHHLFENIKVPLKLTGKMKMILLKQINVGYVRKNSKKMKIALVDFFKK